MGLRIRVSKGIDHPRNIRNIIKFIQKETMPPTQLINDILIISAGLLIITAFQSKSSRPHRGRYVLRD